jgi:hypothetical protein
MKRNQTLGRASAISRPSGTAKSGTAEGGKKGKRQVAPEPVFSKELPLPVNTDWKRNCGVRARAGVPASYDELYEPYRKLIDDIGDKYGVTYGQVIDQLRDVKLLEHFEVAERISESFSCKEACALMGMTLEEWEEYLKLTVHPPRRSKDRVSAWYKLEPLTVRGAPCDDDAIYWGQSILLAANFCDSQGFVPSKTPKNPRMKVAFRRHLTKILQVLPWRDLVDVSQIAATGAERPATVQAAPADNVVVPFRRPERSKDSQVEIAEPTWPRDLPRTYEAVMQMYGSYVYHQVRHVSRIKTVTELEEVNQIVWLKLIEADVLNKFAQTAMSKVASSMTFVEALAYLGVTADEFVAASKQATWKVEPLSGEPLEPDAIYFRGDLDTMEMMGYFPEQRGPRRKPEPCAKGFKSYLGRAVHNHFVNLLRTRSRRHKERGMDSRIVLTGDTAGIYNRVAVLEEASSWEDNLSDTRGAPIEDLMDLAQVLRHNDIDPQTQEGITILDLMSKGYSVGEAKKSQERSQLRLKSPPLIVESASA